MKKGEQIRKFLDSIDILIANRKYLKVEKYLKEYIELNGNNDYPVIRKLAWILTTNGKFDEAIEILQILFEKKNFKSSAAYQLSYIYCLLGQYEKSIEYINICLNIPIKSEKFKNEILF